MKPIQFLALINLLRTEAEGKADLSLSTLQVLLLVANQPGITLTELKKQLNGSYANISRMCRILGKGEKTSDENNKRIRKEGLELILVDINDNDFRQRTATLTPRGEALFKKIAEI